MEILFKYEFVAMAYSVIPCTDFRSFSSSVVFSVFRSAVRGLAVESRGI